MQKILILVMAVCLSMAACAGTSQRRAASVSEPAKPEPTAVQEAPEPQMELPLPEVPAMLREPSLRAAYIIEHFWDAMDFADTLRSHSTDFMEQNFSNFVSVFPYADEKAQRKAVDRLMTAAQADSAAYYKLADIAEKYLYDPNSPMLSEDYYILFLEKLVDSPLAGDYGAIRYRYQLEAALKNRPGTIASDFAYVERNGRSYMLRSTPVEGALLVIFYDPECDHCKDIMASIYDDASISAAVADGRLTVLALYADGERALWERTAKSLPKEWRVGFVTSDIAATQRYVLRAMPTLYLLDADKRIILKDAPPALVSEMFSR